MGYSIAYNSGSTVPFGTYKQGNILMGLKPQEYTTVSGFTWYANAETPNDNYLIISDTYSQGWSDQQNSKPTIWRSETGTTESFVSLVNQLPDVNGVTGFTDSGTAMKYLMDSGKYFVSKGNYLGIVTNGLVLNVDAGWYPSYSGLGTTWKDLKGTNNGTLTNGPTFSTDGGGSISFDGSDDFVYFGNPQDLQFNNATFSYGCWFYWTNTNTVATLMGKRDGANTVNVPQNSNYNQYNITIAETMCCGPAGKKLGAYLACDAGIVQGGALIANLPNTVGWVHAFVSVNTTEQKLYLNGVLSSTTNQNFTGRTFKIVGRSFYVGAVGGEYEGNIIGGFNNKIAIAQVYNRTLSASEVLQNYNVQKGRFGL